ncbi:MAG: IS110 family transposase [Actinobacteria bacterium]|nr:IS110 family transposase [Actinomycetota bacterium]
MGVVVGVDSHKSSLAVAVLDDVGREIGNREFPNDAKGHASLTEWVTRHGSERVIGIEGSGNYGAGLARHLLERGEHVCEVPAFLSHRERKKRPSAGKSDAQDAVAIARVVACGEGLSSPQRSGAFADLKLLSDHRDQLIRSRTQLINRTHKDLVVSHPGYERRIPKLTSKKNLQAATTLLRGERSIRANLIRERIGDLRRLSERIAVVEKQIAAKVIECGTSLTQLHGIGFLMAAKILGEVGDPARLRSKASFAMFTGTAPLEASSGRTKRHRLNRGGNRQLNYALHMMAIARRRGNDDTKTYMARLRSEGKSEKEAMRCLKRQLSNVVFRQLLEETGTAARAA